MTLQAPAPQVEIGYAQAVNYQWWLYENETTPELIWPQSTFVFDSMRRTDSQVTSVLRAMTLPVRRTPWRIDPNGARPEIVRFVADDLGLPVVGEKAHKPPPRSKDRFSWPDHLRQALLMLSYGHMYFEQVYRVEKDGSAAHLRKLAPRMPKTIERIDVASDGGLIGIKQYWSSTNTAQQMIPVNRLVAYIHEREGGNWLGTSILRPAYKNWLLKDRLLRVQAQTIERNGMGIPLYKAAEGATEMATGLAMAKAWRAGDAAGSAVPFGADLILRGVEGTLPDAEPAVRYHDEQIGRAVLAHFLNLGTQTGSWALGTTFADFFTLSLQTLADQVADTATQHIVEDLVDINFGEDEPAPRIVCDEIGSRQAATAEALAALIDSGVIRPDEVLEESSRQQYGLPPADPSTTRTPPAPGGGQPPIPTDGSPTPGDIPSATPDAGATDASAAVAAMQGVAASAAAELLGEEIDEQADLITAVLDEWVDSQLPAEVEAKYNPDELRIPGGKGGGRWTANPIGKAISDALEAWGKGQGPDDPFVFDGKEIPREALRKAAVDRGHTFKRGVSREDIVHALLGGVRDEVKTQRAERQKRVGSAKFSIAGPDGRKIDVAVYTGADPNKPTLREITSANRPGRVITTQDDLAGLEKWANDNGHTDVAQWAASERARVEAKNAPKAAKKAAKKALPVEVPAADTSADFQRRADTALTGPRAMQATHRQMRGDDAEVVDDYRADSSTRANDALRKYGGDLTRLTKDDQRVVTDLDRIIGSSPLTKKDVVVYRGVGSGRRTFGEAGPVAGAEWTDHGFVATTAGGSADPLWTGHSGVQMRILVPAGTRAMSNPDHLDDDEVLLPRGLRYRVVKDHGRVNGVRHVDVEVVGSGDAPGKSGPAVSVLASDLPSEPDKYLGKTVRFTVPDRYGREGKDKTYEGKLLSATRIAPSGGDAATGVRIEGVTGTIIVPDTVSAEVHGIGAPKAPAKKAATKAAKAAPKAPAAPKLAAADRAQAAKVASAFHEDWRKTRLQPDGSFEPRVKTTKDAAWIKAHGTDQVDIANSTYADLPEDWKAENKAAAEVVQGILKAHGGTVDLSDEKTRLAVGEQIHQAWLSRNDWAKGGELDVPFADLPRSEQDKDTDQLKVAMGALAPSAAIKRVPKAAKAAPKPVAELGVAIRQGGSEGEIVRLVNAHDMTPSQLRELAAGLDINVPADMRSRQRLELHIAHEANLRFGAGDGRLADRAPKAALTSRFDSDAVAQRLTAISDRGDSATATKNVVAELEGVTSLADLRRVAGSLNLPLAKDRKFTAAELRLHIAETVVRDRARWTLGGDARLRQKATPSAPHLPSAPPRTERTDNERFGPGGKKALPPSKSASPRAQAVATDPALTDEEKRSRLKAMGLTPGQIDALVPPAGGARPKGESGAAVSGRSALAAGQIDLSGSRKVPGVSDAERKAADLYASDAQRINSLVREGRTGSATIRNLDSLLGRSSVSSDVELWRGLRSGDGVFGSRDPVGDLTGAEFTEPGYLSTSANRRVAEQFAGSFGDPTPVVMHLVAPAGTHAVTMSDWGSGDAIGGQAEVLLQRGLRMRVVADHGVEPHPGIPAGVRRLDVEIVPAEATSAIRSSAPGEPHHWRHGWIRIDVRPALADAKNLDAITAATHAELERITGRPSDTAIRLNGLRPAVAKEYAEGLLKAQEAFPKVHLKSVMTVGPGTSANIPADRFDPTWFAFTGGGADHGHIMLGTYRTEPELRDAMAKNLAEHYSVSGDPTSTAIHEFGHLLADDPQTQHDILQVVTDHAMTAAEDPEPYAMRHISVNAAATLHELGAEAFTDVMTNGSAADPLSHAIVDVMRANYERLNP